MGKAKSPPTNSYDVFKKYGNYYGYFIFNRGCGKQTTKEMFDCWDGFRRILKLDGKHKVTVEPDPRLNQTERSGE